jgi:hypothetical protein
LSNDWSETQAQGWQPNDNLGLERANTLCQEVSQLCDYIERGLIDEERSDSIISSIIQGSDWKDEDS